MKNYSKGYLMSEMRQTLKTTNRPLFNELVKDRTLGEWLESRAERVMKQLESLVQSGLREDEAFEYVRDEVLLMK